MKKSLLLLPLAAAMTCGLASCDFINGILGKKDSEKGGASGDVVLDFSETFWKEDKITPYVEDGTTLYNFTYNDITYNDKGSFVSTYDGDYYLMMKNKWEDGKVVEGEEFAFISNATSYGKTIKSIDVDISSHTGGVTFYVSFGKTAFETSSTSGVKKVATASTAASFTAKNTTDGEYFVISATRDVGQYRKNGGIAKLTIHF